MTSPAQLAADIRRLVVQAKRDGQLAVNMKWGQATLAGALPSSRVTFMVWEAVEAEGRQFILRAIPVYRAAAGSTPAPLAKRTIRAALEDYLEEAHDWGRSASD